jgi:hypothetical protein
LQPEQTTPTGENHFEVSFNAFYWLYEGRAMACDSRNVVGSIPVEIIGFFN